MFGTMFTYLYSQIYIDFVKGNFTAVINCLDRSQQLTPAQTKWVLANLHSYMHLSHTAYITADSGRKIPVRFTTPAWMRHPTA